MNQSHQMLTDLELTKALDLFITFGKSKNLAKTTLNNYTKHNREFIEFTEVEKTVELNQPHIYEWTAHLKDRFDSPHSVNAYIASLKAFVGFLVQDGYIDDKSLKISLIKAPRKVKEAYTREELAKLLKKPDIKTCGFPKYRNWVIINFLLATGVRRRNVVDLKIENLDFQNRMIKLEETKSGSGYMIPMSNELSKILREYLSYRDGTPTDYVFCNRSGAHLPSNSLTMFIRRYNLDRGVQKTSVHQFRHTFAKMSIEQGVDPIRLQRMLGHATLEMTQRYVQMYGTDLKEGFDKFNPLEGILRGN